MGIEGRSEKERETDTGKAPNQTEDRYRRTKKRAPNQTEDRYRRTKKREETRRDDLKHPDKEKDASNRGQQTYFFSDSVCQHFESIGVRVFVLVYADV